MRRALAVAIIVWGMGGAAPAQLTASRGEITVYMEGFRSDAGEARVALFSSKDGFPDATAQARKVARVNIKNYEARADLTDVPYGTYAVAVLHDENSNGVMDRNLFKVPTEGYGASNNPAGSMERLDFDDAKFALAQKSLVIHVYMQY